jgi:hypothetical protein
MPVEKKEKAGGPFDPSVRQTMKALKHPVLASPKTGLPKMKGDADEEFSKIAELGKTKKEKAGTLGISEKCAIM